MSPRPGSWPRLSELIDDFSDDGTGISIPKLDRREAKFPIEKLRNMRARARGDVAALLDRMIGDNALVRKLNAKQKADVRAENIALHLIVAERMLPTQLKKKQFGRIADLWGCTGQHAEDLCTKDRRKAAQQWLENLREYVFKRSDLFTHEQIDEKIYVALDKDLTVRATGMGRKKG